MTTELWLIAVLYILTMVCGAFFFREKKQEVVQQAPSNDYDTLMGILDKTIHREITYKDKLDYKVKDTRIIYDFQEDMTEITKRIMFSLSTSFLDELQYYHPREYIIQYVTRYVEVYLIEFTRQNKIKTK